MVAEEKRKVSQKAKKKARGANDTKKTAAGASDKKKNEATKPAVVKWYIAELTRHRFPSSSTSHTTPTLPSLGIVHFLTTNASHNCLITLFMIVFFLEKAEGR